MSPSRLEESRLPEPANSYFMDYCGYWANPWGLFHSEAFRNDFLRDPKFERLLSWDLPTRHPEIPAGSIWAGNLRLPGAAPFAVVIERIPVLASEHNVDRPPLRWHDCVYAATGWEKLPEKYRWVAKLARSAEEGRRIRPVHTAGYFKYDKA